jgi:ribose 5-phosphate isomerase A
MNDKQRVADYAAQRVQNGMTVGLGTGSTANCFIKALAERCRNEDLQIDVVASSTVSAIKAQAEDLRLLGLEHVTHLDLYVDGADEVAPDMTLLKGRGSDLVREKLLAASCDEFWVLIDAGKRVEYIGQRYPVPVEVLPFAWRMVRAALTRIGGRAELRTSGDGLAVTSHGCLVLDTLFEPSRAVEVLNQQLNAMPGVAAHGLFYCLATGIFCSENGGVSEQRR